ncbi:MAG: hypothetical protein ABW122_08130 [Ilumatobacteraceae bacterium]
MTNLLDLGLSGIGGDPGGHRRRVAVALPVLLDDALVENPHAPAPELLARA